MQSLQRHMSDTDMRTVVLAVAASLLVYQTWRLTAKHGRTLEACVCVWGGGGKLYWSQPGTHTAPLAQLAVGPIVLLPSLSLNRAIPSKHTPLRHLC